MSKSQDMPEPPAAPASVTPRTIVIEGNGVVPAQGCCGGYLQSCGEFVSILRSPLGHYKGTFSELLAFNQRDPVLALSSWMGINFLYGALTALVNLVFLIIQLVIIAASAPVTLPDGTQVSAAASLSIVTVILSFIWAVAWSYFWSHLVWFCTVKVDGCGCGSCCYLLLALLNFIGAFLLLLNNFLILLNGLWFAIPAVILYLGYMILAVYEGKNLFDIFQAGGNYAATVGSRPPVAAVQVPPAVA